MFTGIVQSISHIKKVIPLEEDKGDRFIIQKPLSWEKFQLGESISVSGVCLTLIEWNDQELVFERSPETIRRANFNSCLNLERSLKVGDFLGGHFVYGHVDGTLKILNQEKLGNFDEWEFSLPKEESLVVEKGSIALDGISLTVSKRSKNSFKVALVPHTIENTNFKALKVGDQVNYEADIIARYIRGGKWSE